MKKVSVIIGRYQPFHLGHLEMVKKASEISDEIILFIGSSNKQISEKDPWTARERLVMVYDVILSQEDLKINRFHFFPAMDSNVNDVWVKQILMLTKSAVGKKADVTLVGHQRDESSFYLKLFPMWKFHEVGILKNDISATKIRELYFADKDINEFVPQSVSEYLKKNKEMFFERFKNKLC